MTHTFGHRFQIEQVRGTAAGRTSDFWPVMFATDEEARDAFDPARMFEDCDAEDRPTYYYLVEIDRDGLAFSYSVIATAEPLEPVVSLADKLEARARERLEYEDPTGTDRHRRW